MSRFYEQLMQAIIKHLNFNGIYFMFPNIAEGFMFVLVNLPAVKLRIWLDPEIDRVAAGDRSAFN